MSRYSVSMKTIRLTDSNVDVREDGVLFSRTTGKQIKPFRAGRLLRVSLYRRGAGIIPALRSVVAEAFLGACPNYHAIRHLDGNADNCSASNLLYIDLSADEEGWKRIPGFSNYRVNELGDVQSCKRSLNYVDWFTLKQRSDAQGYRMLSLTSEEGRLWQPLVHRLVLLAFVGEYPAGQETRHLDGDRSNNTLSNLRYGTPAENTLDKFRHGTVRRGDELPIVQRFRRIAETHGDTIRSLYCKHKHGVSASALAKQFHTSVTGIQRIIAHEV